MELNIGLGVTLVSYKYNIRNVLSFTLFQIQGEHTGEKVDGSGIILCVCSLIHYLSFTCISVHII